MSWFFFSNIFESGALVFEVLTHCAYLITFFCSLPLFCLVVRAENRANTLRLGCFSLFLLMQHNSAEVMNVSFGAEHFFYNLQYT